MYDISLWQYLYSYETPYDEPQIPGVPERKWKYYTFCFHLYPEEQFICVETIDWPIPLCMNPEEATEMIDRYFERGYSLWDACWNWYLEGHDLYEIPRHEEYPGQYDFEDDFADYCDWISLFSDYAIFDGQDLDLSVFSGPYHVSGPEEIDAPKCSFPAVHRPITPLPPD